MVQSLFSLLRTFFCCALLLCGMSAAHATAWVTTGPGNVTSLSSWTNGTTSPTTFATPGDTWTVNHAMTFPSGTPWVLGTASATPATLSIAMGGKIRGSGAGLQMPITVHGPMTIADTIAANGNGARLFVVVNGNYTMTGGGLIGTGDGMSITLTVNGTFTANNGGVLVSGMTVNDTVLVRGNITLSGTAYMSAVGTAARGNMIQTMPTGSPSVTLANTSNGPWSWTDLHVAVGCVSTLVGNLSTNTGASYNGLIVHGTLIAPVGTSVMGMGFFTITSGGKLTVANALGIDGMTHNTGGRNFDTGASFEFNGTVPQVSGAYMPTTLAPPSVVTINNPMGVTFSSVLNTTGNIHFVAGILHSPSYWVRTLCAPGRITGAGALSYVRGQLQKDMVGCATAYFEIGDTNYAPVTLTFDAAATSGIAMARVYAGPHPNLATSGISSTMRVNNYWTLSTGFGFTGPTQVNIMAHYNATSIVGGSNAVFAARRRGPTSWTGTPAVCSNTPYPYSSAMVAAIPINSLSATYIFGNPDCGTLPVTGTPTVCAGGTTTLSCATPGGTWSTGSPGIVSVSGAGVVSGVSAGVAIITYDVGGCMSAMEVTVNAAPSAGTISGVVPLCVGVPHTLGTSVAGGVWSSSATGVATVSAAGAVTGISTGTAVISYTVTGLCGTATATQIVTVGTLPVVAGITGPDTVCVGSTITLANTTLGGFWSHFDVTKTTIAGGLVTGMAAGYDTVYYDVGNTCGTVRVRKTIRVVACPPVAVAHSVQAEVFDLYPNPANGFCTFVAPTGTSITLYNMVGQVVMQHTSTTPTTTLPLVLPPGMYTTCMMQGPNRHYGKLVIQ